VFSEFELEKLRKTRSKIFIQRQKWKKGVEKKHGGGKRKIRVLIQAKMWANRQAMLGPTHYM
jgi:hypothetical protein